MGEASLAVRLTPAAPRPGPPSLTSSPGLSFHLRGQSRSPAFSVLPPGPRSGASAGECHSPPKLAVKVHLRDGGPVGVV